MCNESALAGIFGRFAGQTAGQDTIDAMTRAATENGYTLRLLKTDEYGTESDRRSDRVNIHIDRQSRVSGYFHVG